MFLHIIDIFLYILTEWGLLKRGEINMLFSCHFPWWMEEGRMKIVNRQGKPQTNSVMDTMGVYEFALGLFGL